jgi:small subunit ribosomal protein S9|uniref:30S ribosomal protein S9 n=1 Tax=Ochromonas sp. CCMP1393 TaxID=420556 RepID=A0A0D3MK69_9STRA|nr:30S ribosomal protein S9 [Ochromonas sp. CCMP1393]
MNTKEYLYSAIGKRKTSVAKVFLKEGSGIITVNQKKFEDFFASVAEEREKMKNPFVLVELDNKYDLTISVKGGGVNSQMDAIRLAISKAICTINTEYKQILNKDLLLRRDSRIKERRKYGLKKARKASQYSKR